LLALSLLTSAATAKKINGFTIKDPLIPTRLIKSGGPPRDGIPSIDTPQFLAATDAEIITDSDRVLGIRFKGIARAYPIKILNYHEIVNDEFASTPVTVTFCPLCGTGIAFLAVVDDMVRSFGVSGLLYNSDVLMYDRETESLWSQILGKAISGPSKGQTLDPVPVLHTTWADWRRRHPDTSILAVPRPISRNYTVDPYLGYADSKRIWFPVTRRDKRYPAKSVILGTVIDGQPHAWPFIELPSGQQVLTDHVAGHELTVEYDQTTYAARILNTQGDEIPSFTAYWFAWAAFHPDTSIWQP
jgi:hypothetical protein